MKVRLAVFLWSFFYYSLSLSGQSANTLNPEAWPENVLGKDAAKRSWNSGLELGTGLSFTGYNANFAYTGHFGDNLIFLGPKIVYSDANGLFDAPWGLHLGYRRLFPINQRFAAFASLEYQNIYFRFENLGAKDWNSIHELHASYGFRYEFNNRWYIGQSIGLGGYIERLVDPFDRRVDTFNGFSPQARLWLGYKW
jgi:hypothetical protein